jgi:hypothetical protein
MTSGFKSLVGFVLALTNISKSSQCDFGMKHVFWGHLFLEVQTNGYCDLSRLCKLGCFHQMFVHASYIICVATPLWPSVGVKPNTSKVGDLESFETPECLELDSKAQNTSH